MLLFLAQSDDCEARRGLLWVPYEPSGVCRFQRWRTSSRSWGSILRILDAYLRQVWFSLKIWKTLALLTLPFTEITCSFKKKIAPFKFEIKLGELKNIRKYLDFKSFVLSVIIFFLYTSNNFFIEVSWRI